MHVNETIYTLICIKKHVLECSFSMLSHTSLEGRGGVAQSEWHVSEGEGAKRTCERRLLLIVRVDSNPIVVRISIEEAEVTRSC